MYQYYLTDAVGSVVALTDQNGVVQTQYSYGPFGATASTGAASDNPYQFAGRELDPNGGFGIYYFRARYYDSLELNHSWNAIRKDFREVTTPPCIHMWEIRRSTEPIRPDNLWDRPV